MNSQEEVWLLDEKYGGEKSEAFFADLALLQAGTPLAYLIGSIPFLNTNTSLASHPLIPRPETEFWTEKAISHLRQKHGSESISLMDLCAGSGCIGIATGVNIPSSHITFVELDKTHLPTIKNNADINNLPEGRFDIIESDLFSNIPTNNKFHAILSNPPYIDPALDRAEKSVKLHEPSLALYGGLAGMDLIEKIINSAPSYLHGGGELWLEHEPEQVSAINDLAQSHFQTYNHKDQYGVYRYSQLVLK
jgi:release factor glutamine methyltransferase